MTARCSDFGSLMDSDRVIDRCARGSAADQRPDAPLPALSYPRGTWPAAAMMDGEPGADVHACARLAIGSGPQAHQAACPPSSDEEPAGRQQAATEIEGGQRVAGLRQLAVPPVATRLALGAVPVATRLAVGALPVATGLSTAVVVAVVVLAAPDTDGDGVRIGDHGTVVEVALGPGGVDHSAVLDVFPAHHVRVDRVAIGTGARSQRGLVADHRSGGRVVDGDVGDRHGAGVRDPVRVEDLVTQLREAVGLAPV